MSTGNDPHFDWPLDPGERGREVWYSLVSHPTKRLAFWYRFTLLSTDAGHQEARVWSALTDPENGGFFQTRRYPLDEIDSSSPLSLRVGANELTSSSAEGHLQPPPGERDGGQEWHEDSRSEISWEFVYDPDTVTFTPLRSKWVTDFAVKFLGSGRHWSFNESIRMDGTLEFGDREIAFEDAPGHQGHTVGTTAPERWSWLHCNTFDEDVVIEALDVEGKLSICFRRGDETYFLNRLKQVLWTNRTKSNEPGAWRFGGSAGDLDLDVIVHAEPETWKYAAYLTPDDTSRYVSHSSLATVEVRYELDGESHTISSDAARAEWAGTEPPVSGNYRPGELDHR